MLRVGLTGGTGAGKSSVARRLSELGAVVVDADALAREVLAPGSEGLAAVVAEFGPEVLDGDGGLDRAALARVVFADADRRAALERITHPRIAALTAQQVAAAPADAVVVHDVPLLVEKRMGAGYHLVVVVHAPAAERVRRLVAHRGMTAEDAWARVRAQASDDERRAAADVWLDNSGTPADLAAAVDDLWRARLVPYEENVRLGRPAPGWADGGTGQRPDPGAGARVAARVAHAVRAVLPDAVVRVDAAAPLTVVVRGGVAAGSPDDAALAATLRAAGFPPVAEGVHASADPGLPARVLLARLPGAPAYR